MQHWLAKVGLGPFYIIENVQYAEAFHRGHADDIDMAVALAQWGEVQVELIQQRNDAPSIYTEFPGRKLGGLQHRRRHDAQPRRTISSTLRAEGIEPVQWGATGQRHPLRLRRHGRAARRHDRIDRARPGDRRLLRAGA